MVCELKKAGLFKRFSAFFVDIIIFCLVALELGVLLAGLLGYNATADKLESYYTKYEEMYNIDTQISQEEYNALSDADRARYDEATEAFANDEEVSATYSMLINKTLIVVSIAMLVTFILTEFVMPLIFKNGQTVGKKLFGVAVMRTDGVRISAFQVFVRAVFGKFTIETMLPAFLLIMVWFGAMSVVGIVVIILYLILQIVCMAVTNTNSMIHDMLAVTVTVDSINQMIFDTPEAMMAYKNKLHEEAVQKSPY